MEDKRTYIDDLFREELGGYREQPDPDVWNKLEKRLDEGRGKKRILIWWVTALALLVAVSSLLLTGAFTRSNHATTVADATIHHAAVSNAPITHATINNTATPGNPSAVAVPAPQRIEHKNRNKQNTPALPVTKQQTLAHAKTTTPAITSPNEPVDVITTPAEIATPSPVSTTYRQTNTDAPSTTTPQAVSTAPVPASGNTAGDMFDNLPLPTAGAPKKQQTVQIDISKYEPLITRSNRNAANMVAASGKQLPPMTSKTQGYEAIPSAAATIETAIAPQAAPQAEKQTETQDSKPVATTTPATTAAPAPQEVIADTGRKRNPIKWDYGVKTGYEISTNKYSAGNGILGVYLQANINKRIAVIMQPTAKYASLKRTTLDNATPYYDVKNNSTTALHIISPEGADIYGNPIYNIIRRYFYAQQYDSISVTKTIRPKQYFEFELPVLLQYRFTKQLSINAGISANFSKLVQIDRDEQRFAGKMRYDTLVFAQVNESSPAPTIPGIETRINYNYSPYKDFAASEKLNADGSPIRFNYMLGVNYALRNGLSFDVLMISMLNNANYIPDERVRSIYKRPYIRIGVTYKLNKK